MFEFIIIVSLVVAFIKISNLKNRVTTLEGGRYQNQTDVRNHDGVPASLIQTDEVISTKVSPSEKFVEEIQQKSAVETLAMASKVEIPEPIIIEKKEGGQNLEFKFGAKFFTVIGSIAITFGVGYFLKYAIDNGMISEIWRVIIGIVLGISMATLGIKLSKKYSLFGQILSGTGLGLIYLSVYSAYGFYHLVPVSVGFIGLVIVTIAGMTLSVYQNLLWMAVFSQIGAYLAPLLLSNGENNPHVLFMYVIGVILGTFGVAWFKLWRPLIIVNFIATVLIFLSWAAKFLSINMVGVAVTYLTIFFALFTAILFVNYVVRKSEQNSDDFVLLSANSMLTFVGYYAVVNQYYHDWMGGLTIAFSLVHFLLLLLVRKEGESSHRLKEFLLAIGSVLFTLALPIIFDSNSVLTIAWSIEAAVLIMFGLRLKSYTLRFIGLAIQLIVLARVMFLDVLTATHLPTTTAFLNERFLTFFLITVITAFIGWMYYKSRDQITESEIDLIKIFPVLVVIQILVFGTVEISDFLANYWIIVFWSIIMSGTFIFGNIIKSSGLIILGYLVMIGTIINFFSINPSINNFNPFFNPYFAVLIWATIMGAISVTALRTSDDKRGETSNTEVVSYLSIYSFLALAVAFSKEIISYDYSYALLPIVWSVCGAALLFIGYYLKSAKIRFTTYFSVMVAGIYCLLYVTSILIDSNYNLIFNYRFSALFVVAIISLWIVYLTRSREEILNEEKKNVSFVFSAIGNVLLLVGISQEVWNVVTKQIHVANDISVSKLTQFRDVLLSITWAIYGSILMMFGIYKRNRFSRLFGLGLLGIVIFKIFFIDAAGLETIYKILAYITLGIILLVSGFLYNKFKDRIMEFVKD